MDTLTTNWEDVRSSLLKSVLKREETPSICKVCYEKPCSIRCFDCSNHDLCEVCDKDIHETLVFHDRLCFNDGYFKPLSSNEIFKDGQILSYGKYIVQSDFIIFI